MQKKYMMCFGVNAIHEIEINPYVLIDITYGVDFKKIDKMAMDLGLPYNSDKRIESGMKYGLILATYNGHTCIAKENLIQFVIETLDVERKDIENCFINLNGRKEIIVENIDDIEWVYLYPFYKAEQNIAEKMQALLSSKNSKYIKNFENERKKQESLLDIELSEKQKEALTAVNDNNVCIITGGPGTGKTTIIKEIIAVYENRGKKVVLCAPTGRAAKRMTETTGREAKTIHRLLEIGKLQDESKLENIDYDVAPIDADVIIIDEMSMVDLFLMNYLCKGIYLGTKLVLVGDSNQLPSVGPGSILKDMIESEKIPVISLNKIFRQAARSKIIVNAHQVNQGEGFIPKGSKEAEETEDDFFYVNEASQDKMLYQVVTLAKDRLKNYGNYEFFKDMQVLTPTKKGMLGTKELNKALQSVLNPEKPEKLEKSYGEQIFREGDRVMQIKNDYDIYWDKKGSNENGTGIFNGEIGTIVKIDHVAKQLKIEFDDEKVSWYAFNNLEELELAYSITIHKSQGSEFNVVILVIPPSSPMLLTRNLLYTAITRAKKLLVIIGSNKLIDFMIQNAESKTRNTGLEYKIRKLIE